MSGINPSRFGESMPCKRTGAIAAITAGVGCGSGATCGGGELVLYSAVIVFTSEEGGEIDGARTVSNSVAEITPLSRKSVARRSLCSAGEALDVIARTSASVMIPFAWSTRTRGSLVSALCEKTTGAHPQQITTIKTRRRNMIDPFWATKRHKRHIPVVLLCFLCLLWLLFAVATGQCAKPAGVVRPGPIVSNSAIDHRVKRARLMRCAFVDVDDEAGQHHQRGEIVNHITHRHDPTPTEIVKPHQ